MNMFKKKDGFTLVELIVVIAILAILAGVAVPAYTGYMTKAKQSGDIQVLSSVNTAAQGLAAAEGETVTKIEVTNANGTVTVEVTSTPDDTITQTEVLDLTGTLTFSADFTGATWESGEWTLD